MKLIPPDDTAVRVHIGIVIHSMDSGERGFRAWNTWAKPAVPDEKVRRAIWRSFRQVVGNPHGALRYYEKRGMHAALPTDEHDIVAYAHAVLNGRLRIAGEKFFVFGDQKGWRSDETAAARALLEIIKDLHDIAQRSEAHEAVRVLKKFLGFAKVKGMLAGFRAYSDLDVMDSDFDSKPELLGVPSGGVVDLRTGEFRAAEKDDMVSLAVAVPYNVGAKCPKFLQFIRQIAKTREYQNYVQTALGYLLIGHSNDQIAFFMLGRGGNGKGTLTRAIQAVMGAGYSTTISTSFLRTANNGNGDKPTEALMKLKKVRAAFCTETEQRKGGINESFFKQVTGGDALSGRHGHGEQENFTPPGKLMISLNRMPDWAHKDDALWRRVVVLPFSRQFMGERVNTNLATELTEEAAGILQWMIVGAQRYLEHGLGECPEVVEATKHARERADTVQMWIDAECVTGKHQSVQARESFEAYCAFADREQLQALDNRKFSVRLQALGFRHHRLKQFVEYEGIGLKPRI